MKIKPDAFELGFAAGTEGKSSKENPFRDGTLESQDWFHGYYNALEEIAENESDKW